MRSKHYVACLLALAGTACIFLAARLTPPRPSHPPVTASILPQELIEIAPARSVSKHEAAPRTNRVDFGGPADGRGRPPDRGLAKFSIPVTFEPNVGQAGDGVQFLGRGKGLTVALMRDEIAVQV